MVFLIVILVRKNRGRVSTIRGQAIPPTEERIPVVFREDGTPVKGSKSGYVLGRTLVGLDKVEKPLPPTKALVEVTLLRSQVERIGTLQILALIDKSPRESPTSRGKPNQTVNLLGKSSGGIRTTNERPFITS